MIGLPELVIAFKDLSRTVVERSKRGVLALILIDATSTKGLYKIKDETDIPSDLSDTNKNLIESAFIGNVTSPNSMVLCVLNTVDDLEVTLNMLETEEFNLVCMVGASETENTSIKNLVKNMRDNVKYKVCGLISSEEVNTGTDIGIFNYTNDVTIDDITIPAKDFVGRIGGIICGTPLSQAITNSILLDVENIPKETREETNARVKKGEIALIKDAGSIRIARGVTTSISESTPNYLRKIKSVMTTDLIHNDFSKIIKNQYLGKVPNKYMNKVMLMKDMRAYLETLADEDLIENNFTVEIDLKEQKKYLKSIYDPELIDSLSEQKLKEYNTKDKVFILVKITLLDAMEDFYINIEV